MVVRGAGENSFGCYRLAAQNRKLACGGDGCGAGVCKRREQKKYRRAFAINVIYQLGVGRRRHEMPLDFSTAV